MARRVLITGTSRGIGRGLAEYFLARGDIVFGCARGDSDLSDERYQHYRVDVTDETAVQGLFNDIRKNADGLDVLINNAGTASMSPLALTALASARRILDVNVLGSFLFTRSAVRLLRTSTAARIVNVSSIAVPLRLDGEALYAAAKSAVETFTRIAARELGPLGITCNAVGPSVLQTRLTEGVPAPKLQALICRQSVPHRAEIGDVANVIEFFARPESRLVTGQVVYLGGFS